MKQSNPPDWAVTMPRIICEECLHEQYVEFNPAEKSGIPARITLVEGHSETCSRRHHNGDGRCLLPGENFPDGLSTAPVKSSTVGGLFGGPPVLEESSARRLEGFPQRRAGVFRAGSSGEPGRSAGGW